VDPGSPKTSGFGSRTLVNSVSKQCCRSESGSRRSKVIHKNRKSEETACIDCWCSFFGVKASPVAWDVLHVGLAIFEEKNTNFF
jgi:hypothetical protein